MIFCSVSNYSKAQKKRVSLRHPHTDRTYTQHQPPTQGAAATAATAAQRVGCAVAVSPWAGPTPVASFVSLSGRQTLDPVISGAGSKVAAPPLTML